MTQSVFGPIVSGRAYPVLKVAAGEPAALEDFHGETHFEVDLDGGRYRVHGVGRPVVDGVRFYQKDQEGAGRDIRKWAVRPSGDGIGFVAEHVIGADRPA